MTLDDLKSMPSLEADFHVASHVQQAASPTIGGTANQDAPPSTASGRIRQRLRAAGVSFFANDNIAAHLGEGELEALEDEVTQQVRGLLKTLVIDVDNDHNTAETAERVARMYLHEVFKGRYHPQPKVASFPNVKELDEIYTVGPITVRSACSHHLVPILGHCWIGIQPGERVIGLSKFSRVADWVFSRPHIQEEAVIILADEIETLCKPLGLGIVLKAQHYCMKWRGVKEPQASMVNSVVRGSFRASASMKKEFFDLIRQQESLL
ncbi:MAG: GTP cyclohydrolase I [Cyanobacteria bacterium MAG CAR2_bin_4]|nr:GTP cyclohydrolase I [Cyanobacteria bacterium MAG CAR2_bin_4]